MHASLKLFILGILFSSFPAQAEFFKCQFTEPFASLLVSTIHKTVNVSFYGNNNMSGTQKILKQKSNGSHLSLSLNNGRTLEIYKNKAGNDGMSDYLFPYDAKYGNLWGGCESESKQLGYLLNRVRDLRGSNGALFIDTWPGEYDSFKGYQVLKTVKLPAHATYVAPTTGGDKGSMSCTLPKGKYLVPIKAKKGELFAHFTLPSKVSAIHDDINNGIKKGDEYLLLSYLGNWFSYLGKGYCLMEKDGKIFDGPCNGDAKPFAPINMNRPDQPAPLGNYMFAQCKEGHFAWLHEKTFASDAFKKVNLGF